MGSERLSSGALLEQIREERRRERRKRLLVSSLCGLAAAAVLIFLFLMTIGKPIIVRGTSMERTLKDGDVLLVNSLTGGSYVYGDMVASDIVKSTDGLIIKRVIGIAGDRIEIDGSGAVYVNGDRLVESYVRGQKTGLGDIAMPVTVPEGCVFLMGDNRSHSKDSRYAYIGMVPTKDIIGKVWFRLYPFTRLGGIRQEQEIVSKSE